jgi:hypothetical protein
MSGGEARRNSLIRQMVTQQVAASDAAQELLDLIHQQPANPLAAALLALHARMVRLQAEDDDHLHDILHRADPLSRDIDRLDRKADHAPAPVDDDLAEALQDAVTQAMAADWQP